MVKKNVILSGENDLAIAAKIARGRFCEPTSPAWDSSLRSGWPRVERL